MRSQTVEMAEAQEPSALKREVLSIGKNSSIYFIGQALSKAVGFFMIPIYTKFIAPTNFGAMEMVEILTGCIGLVISMNVAEAMPRFFYAEKERAARNRVVSTIVGGFGLMGIPLVLLFVCLSKSIAEVVLKAPDYTYYLQLSTVTIWFGMLCEICYSYLRMQYMARAFVLTTVLQLALAMSLNIYFIVGLRLDILGVFYSTLITQGLTAAVLIIWILKETGLRISFPLLRRLVAFGLPLVPSRIGLTLGFVSNRFFLLWLGAGDPKEALALVGRFSLGHKFGVVINRFITVPFNSFWSPRRLELLINEEPQARETVARICTYSTLISLYAALVLSAGIESVIEIMANPSYRGAHLVVPSVALAYVALGLETHFSTGLLQCRRTGYAAYIGLLALAVTLVWNYLFVPPFGLVGAATSNLAGFAVRSILIYAVSQRLYRIPFEVRRLLIMFGAAVVVYAASQSLSLSSPYLTFFVRTSLVALYPAFLLLTGFYRPEELRVFRAAVGRMRLKLSF
jgi:O-antigen/teichoic acid export membrane protein